MAFNDSRTKERDPHIKGGKVIAFEVLSSKTIYKGDIVRIPAAGYALSGDGATSIAQYDVCAGIALETVTAPASNTGWHAVKVRVLTEGVVTMYDGSVNANEAGTWAIADASGAYTSTSQAGTLCTAAGQDDANNSVAVGAIIGLARTETTIPDAVSTTSYRVWLMTLRQAYQ